MGHDEKIGRYMKDLRYRKRAVAREIAQHVPLDIERRSARPRLRDLGHHGLASDQLDRMDRTDTAARERTSPPHLLAERGFDPHLRCHDIHAWISLSQPRAPVSIRSSAYSKSAAPP